MKLSVDINQYIQDYMGVHPDFVPPESSSHPCTLALTTAIKPDLVERCGGIVEFWVALYDHARDWFEPDDDCLEARCFRGRLMVECGLSVGTEFEQPLCEVYESYIRWRKSAELEG